MEEVVVRKKMTVKPLYDGGSADGSYHVELSAFDMATDEYHLAAVVVFRRQSPPAADPSNADIVAGLGKVLVAYRELAGRLAVDGEGRKFIHLNDAGVPLVEASVATTLDEALAVLELSGDEFRRLHPLTDDGIEALMQVQLTRFACGSLAVGYTMQHRVADGPSGSSFLVAWGRACRGHTFPLVAVDRTAVFLPFADRSNVAFDHCGVEFSPESFVPCYDYSSGGALVVHKAHLSPKMLASLKSTAAAGSGDRRYTTIETLLAHTWKSMTIARNLAGDDTTDMCISVDGRTRLPGVPANYFGNLMLWAYPHSKVSDLVSRPLWYAAGVIHDAVAKVNEKYFRSFIGFAATEAAKAGLVPVPEPKGRDMCKSMDVDSWLRFPIYDMDFGGGKPFRFLPSYLPVEGSVYLLPSMAAEGCIEMHVPLFQHNIAAFLREFYSGDVLTPEPSTRHLGTPGDSWYGGGNDGAVVRMEAAMSRL